MHDSHYGTFLGSDHDGARALPLARAGHLLPLMADLLGKGLAQILGVALGSWPALRTAASPSATTGSADVRPAARWSGLAP